MTRIEPPALDEFRRAAAGLRAVAVRTPLVPVRGSDREGILLKPEVHQPSGSFKIRGVYHAVSLLEDERRRSGLSTVSAGNTARALAWAGRHFGVPVRSLMPDSAPRTKVDAVLAQGAQPVLVSREELFRFLREHLWEDEPYAFIHPWTERNVMIGHGTLALEILDDLPEVRTVYVPVGGGGLIGGVASALHLIDEGVEVVAVEPAGCAALAASLQLDRPTTVECRTICDGVAVPYVTDEVFALLRPLVHRTIQVEEQDVRAAIRRLAFDNGVIAEGAGALALAAALADDDHRPGPRIALVTGGSIDPDMLLEVLSEGGRAGSMR